MFEPKIRSEQTDLLMDAILHLTSQEDAYRFFEDICTIKELLDLAQRMDVAVLLDQGVNYQTISQQVNVSTATISRVNRALLYGADGYRRVLDALESTEE